MTYLITGAQGQLGLMVQEHLRQKGLEFTALDRAQLDLRDPVQIRTALQRLKPDVIVNCAAYTDVDGAESDRDSAFAINAEAPALLANWCREYGTVLIHYSTDFVYDGSGSTAWLETSPTAPLNVYGQSKLAGDEAVLASGCNTYVFRTSWVFSEVRKNFVKAILNASMERPSLTVVDDQVGAPTHARRLAQLSLDALFSEKKAWGLYHLCPQGEVSRLAMAQLIVQIARDAGAPVKCQAVTGVTTNSLPAKALRPLNSRLSLRKFQDMFALPIPQWQDDVISCVRRLIT